MATKKKNANPLQDLFDACPYISTSEFETKNFNAPTNTSQPRFVIETVNRIRKIDSDLETEKRTFERNCLLEEKSKLEKILQAEDSVKLITLISTWEDYEREYWVDYLGKVAAIEILTNDRPSIDTMTKMVKLPEDDYIKATQICVKLANAIKEATVKAEQEIGIVEQTPTSAPTGPKKLALKKVK